MKIVSINTGHPQDILFNGRTVSTSIVKTPVAGPLKLRALNLEGDQQQDLRVHGGVDKAIFAMSTECYAWWNERGSSSNVAPGPIALGTLGENLSVSGLSEAEICIGDVFSIGTARLEVAQPRFPCHKLQAVLGDLAAGKLMIESGMPGIYFRVLQEGVVEAGQDLVPVKQERIRLSVLELFTAYLTKELDKEKAKAALSIASLMPKWRAFLESQMMLAD